MTGYGWQVHIADDVGALAMDSRRVIIYRWIGEETEVVIGFDEFGTAVVDIHAEQRLAGPADRRKLTGTFLVPTELLADAGFDVGDLLDQMLDRRFRPWKSPDPNPMPRLVLFPTVDRLERGWHSLQDGYRQMADALGDRLDAAGQRLATHYRARRNRRRSLTYKAPSSDGLKKPTRLNPSDPWSPTP